jgi:hypothetical protein
MPSKTSSVRSHVIDPPDSDVVTLVGCADVATVVPVSGGRTCRRRRVYRLTKQGELTLTKRAAEWRGFSRAMDALLKGA